jgi:hypothetical protein
MLSLDDFSPVTLEDRDIFLRHYRKYPRVHSDNSFTNLVCWNHYANYAYAVEGNSIILSSRIENDLSFRPPIGPKDPKLLGEVIRLAAEEGSENALYVFDEPTKEWMNRRYPQITLYPDRDFYDYIYRSSDLADLPGKPYQNIRSHLNKFKRNCEYATEFISNENISDVLKFLEIWCEWKHCDESEVLAHEKEAVLYAIRRFFTLELKGILIRVDGVVSAMAIFEELNPDTAVIHFEKGLPECKGIYKGINQECATYLRDYFAYINRESDLGVPGLREAKTRYHPDHFARVWYAKREELRR